MQLDTTIEAARATFAALPRPLGFVPTMGALHAGHLQLVRRRASVALPSAYRSSSIRCSSVRKKTSHAYPRDLERDSAALAAAGVDVLFAPGPAEMYPPGFSTVVDPGPAGTTFEGAVRPGSLQRRRHRRREIAARRRARRLAVWGKKTRNRPSYCGA